MFSFVLDTMNISAIPPTTTATCFADVAGMMQATRKTQARAVPYIRTCYGVKNGEVAQEQVGGNGPRLESTPRFAVLPGFRVPAAIFHSSARLLGCLVA